MGLSYSFLRCSNNDEAKRNQNSNEGVWLSASHSTFRTIYVQLAKKTASVRILQGKLLQTAGNFVPGARKELGAQKGLLANPGKARLHQAGSRHSKNIILTSGTSRPVLPCLQNKPHCCYTSLLRKHIPIELGKESPYPSQVKGCHKEQQCFQISMYRHSISFSKLKHFNVKGQL